MKIGIDYSLSSPGVCVNTSDGLANPNAWRDRFSYQDCKFYFLTNTKKYVGTFKEKMAFGTSAVEYIGAGLINHIVVNLRDIITLRIGLLI